LISLFTVSAHAQYEKTWKDWYGHFIGAYSTGSGDFGSAVDDGWMLGGGAAYYPGEWPIGIVMQLDYSEYDIARSVLNAVQSSGGDVSITALTAGGVWSARTQGTVGFAVSLGLGAYYVKGNLTEPGVGCGIICDPWYWWWCFPGCTSTTVVTGSASTTRPGANLGLQLSFQLGNDSEIYLEAKYHYINTQVSTTYVPISVGYRW
jgi:hypothetical protein